MVRTNFNVSQAILDREYEKIRKKEKAEEEKRYKKSLKVAKENYKLNRGLF